MTAEIKATIRFMIDFHSHDGKTLVETFTGHPEAWRELSDHYFSCLAGKTRNQRADFKKRVETAREFNPTFPIEPNQIHPAVESVRDAVVAAVHYYNQLNRCVQFNEKPESFLFGYDLAELFKNEEPEDLELRTIRYSTLRVAVPNFFSCVRIIVENGVVKFIYNYQLSVIKDDTCDECYLGDAKDPALKLIEKTMPRYHVLLTYEGPAPAEMSEESLAITDAITKNTSARRTSIRKKASK